MTAYASEKEAAIAAAKRAGDVLLDWAGRFSVRSKGKNDLVTEADHQAQEAIRDSLLRRFPGDGFVGEEKIQGGDTPGKRCWIVDPLDGTTNFVHGFPFFCVSIGLVVGDQVVVGVVHDPVHKECFAGAVGAGTTLNGLPLQVSPNSTLADSLLCVGLPADLERTPVAMKFLDRLSRSSRSVRRLGSAALSLAYVAAGRLDGYWSTFLNPWDAVGGVCLIQQAGGRVTNIGSDSYRVDNPTLLATNGLIHGEMAREIALAGS